MATTTKHSLRKPVGIDTADVVRDVGNLADDVDAKMAIWSSGGAAAKGSAAKSGRWYKETDGSGYLWVDDGAVWRNVLLNGDTRLIYEGDSRLVPPPIVSALPGSPVNGQEIRYQNGAMASEGVVWNLKYRSGASGSYKWEFIGGAELLVEEPVADHQIFVSSSPPTYQPGYDSNASNAQRDVVLTLPLAGDYDFSFGLERTEVDQTAIRYLASILMVGGVIQSTRALLYSGHSQPGLRRTDSHEVRLPGLTATTVQLMHARSASDFIPYFQNRWLRARPVRVG